MTYRILITGERDWEDWIQVHSAIASVLRKLNTSDVVIVHGGCETGADKFAQEFCNINGVNYEVHLADCGGSGKKAGPLRNSEMVDLGAYIVLAFWGATKTTGSGTFDCLTKAVRAGIRVVVYPRRK